MDYIPRKIESEINSRLCQGKAIIIYGPRQSGKTTMLRHLVRPHGDTVLWLNGDSPDIRSEIENITSTKWKAIIGRKRIVVIDEAQRIEGIGLAIKLLVDELADVQVLASGSSSFDLASRTAEPLTGRKFEFQLLPLSFFEMCAHHGLLEEKRSREQRLLFGSYPDIVNHPGDEQPLLSSLAGSYLYKDLLMLDGIKKPSLLDKLVRAVALQLGNEVRSAELATLTGADNKTVDRYLDLLEKSFVLFALPAFSRNARNEIKKSRKIYFFDLGVRNAVLGNFTSIKARTDTGALWENYLILERFKNHCNRPFPPRRFFWRTTEQSEIDYLEEESDRLSAWEFKLNPAAKVKIPIAFTRAYPGAKTGVVTADNYDDFLLT